MRLSTQRHTHDDAHTRALLRFLIKLVRDLEHFLRRVIGSERRRHAGELMDLATLRSSLDDLKLTRGIAGQCLFPATPNARDRSIVLRTEGV